MVGCIVSLSLVLPPGQASAQRLSPSGDAGAYTIFRMADAPRAMGRWDPCRPIGYRVNRARATPGAVADVQEAIRRVSAATGLQFVYRGTTTVVPQAKWSDSPYPADTQLIVAWIRPSQSTLWPSRTMRYSGPDNLAGRGGSWHVRARDKSGRLWGRYNRGFVLLNAGLNFPAGYGATGPSGSRGREIMHELGHVVGLDHPREADRQEVMYPELTRQPARWGRGDLAGLRIVGAGGGCLHDVAW